MVDIYFPKPFKKDKTYHKFYQNCLIKIMCIVDQKILPKSRQIIAHIPLNSVTALYHTLPRILGDKHTHRHWDLKIQQAKRPALYRFKQPLSKNYYKNTISTYNNLQYKF